MRCHFRGCDQPVAFEVTQTNDNGTAPRTFHTCRVHQHGCKVAGWTEPTTRTVRAWRMRGHSGTFTITPLAAPTRRELMALRDIALAARDIPQFQALTIRIAALPLRGVPAPTAASMKRYAAKGQK